MAKNVVLTGFMGTGKTSVGRLVAARLGCEFVDTDEVIVARHGPIPEIFERAGEAKFRQYERAVAAELAARRRLVIATGGRLLLDPVNAEALEATGRVFCLTAELDTILARVTADGIDERPLLAGPDAERRIARLLAERAEAYGRFEQVPTDRRSPADIAADVFSRLVVSGDHRPDA